MSAANPGFALRWSMFVRERFPLPAHLVMAGAFFLGNAAAARVLGQGEPAWWRVAVAFAVVLAFFLRLRIFDELKDLGHDREVNPHRPLARGLIQAAEAKAVAVTLFVGESALVRLCGAPAFAAWGAAALWSLLMYKEFFTGAWLRPRLELYAVSHTLVAGLLGLVPAALWGSGYFWRMDPLLWLMAAANWMLFNVFEFSRKTFAPAEEREGVDSYSSRLGSWGASGLSWICLALAGAFLAFILERTQGNVGPVLVAVPALAGLVPASAYALRPSFATAKAFRAVLLGSALLAYVMLFLAVLVGGAP